MRTLPYQKVFILFLVCFVPAACSDYSGAYVSVAKLDVTNDAPFSVKYCILSE